MKTTALQMLRAGAVLGLFAVVAAGVLAGVQALTAEPIRRAEQARLLAQLRQVLPAGSYDNDVANDTLLLALPALHGATPMTVYRARKDGKPVAAVLTVIAPEGYSGPIELLVGIDHEGRLTGVRALGHRETPGLGDKIELSRSDWVLGFNGRSLTHPEPRRWSVKKDGGVFDQFAGATITPRAVVKAVRATLEYFEQNRESLFATAADAPTPAPATP